MSTWADEDRFYEETEAILRIGITVWDTRPRTASVEVEDSEKNGLEVNVEDAETVERVIEVASHTHARFGTEYECDLRDTYEAHYSPQPTLDEIVHAVETFTGRPAYVEHAGGGMEYLYAALDGRGGFAWLGWSDTEPRTADDATGRETVVAGVMYRLSYTDEYPKGIADTHYGIDDELVTESGLRVAVLRWIARAMAANVDPKTEWQLV